MVSALNVANNILKRGFSEGIDITPMKLQKLTYIVFKKYYQDTGSILFPEMFEVWKYTISLSSIKVMRLRITVENQMDLFLL